MNLSSLEPATALTQVQHSTTKPKSLDVGLEGLTLHYNTYTFQNRDKVSFLIHTSIVANWTFPRFVRDHRMREYVSSESDDDFQ